MLRNMVLGLMQKKSIVMHFKAISNVNVVNSIIRLNDDIIPIVDSAKHLGHMLSTSASGYIDLEYIISQQNKSVNMLMANFGKINSSTLLKLFTHYCNSLYGICLSDLSSRIMERVYICWRKCLKRVMRLPQRTHTSLLYCICNSLPIDLLLCKRMLKFYLSLYFSSNDIIQRIAKRCITQSISNMGRNVAWFHSRFAFMDYLSSSLELSSVKGLRAIDNLYTVNESIYVTASVCTEMIDIRDDVSNHALFSKMDSLSVLNTLCTD